MLLHGTGIPDKYNKADLKMAGPGERMALYLSYTDCNAKKAYKKAVANIKENCRAGLSFEMVSERALEILHLHEANNIDAGRLCGIGIAYAKLGEMEAATNIGLELLERGRGEEYFDPASKVFRKAKLKPEQVLKGIDNMGTKNYYLKNVVESEKKRREETLKKKLENAENDYREVRDPMVEYFSKLKEKLRNAKEINKELSKIILFQKNEIEKNLTSTLWPSYRGTFSSLDQEKKEEIVVKIQYLQNLSGEISENLNGILKNERAISEMKTERSAARERYTKAYRIKRKKFNKEKLELEKKFRKGLQKYMKKLNYKIDLFPRWKYEVEKGELDISTSEGRERLKEIGGEYLLERKYDNAVEILKFLIENDDKRSERELAKLKACLKNACQDKELACKNYLGRKFSLKNLFSH